MTQHQQVIERLTRLETLAEVAARESVESRKDLKILLESKWKRDGRSGAIAALVAALVTLGAAWIPFFKP